MGSQAAFIGMLEPILPDAYRLAFAMLRTSADAEDAVQEAALKAWKSQGRFKWGSPMRPWFLTIVANECRHQRRSRWWSVVRQPNANPSDEHADAHPSDIGLRRAIFRLPHSQRVAIVLRFYLDLSFDEVAQVLGVSTKAAKSRTYRALESLRLNPEVSPDE